MEACASAHYWGREIKKLGHEVRLVPPIYVKPFVKRQKNDTTDAEAICEAAQRPTMRFVAVKGEEQQARGMLFRTRDLLVRQRTQTINALRGHLAEFGIVAPQGRAHVARLALALDEAVVGLFRRRCTSWARFCLRRSRTSMRRSPSLEKDIHAHARRDEDAARLMTIPGVGPICAMAIQAFAPPMESFRCGRDFSAWLGLVPRQHSTGGKPRLGSEYRRWVNVTSGGCWSAAPWRSSAGRCRRGETDDPWLARMLARKPAQVVVAVALANRMARIVWALTVNKEVYRAPAAA